MRIKRPSGGWNIKRAPVHPGEMLREEFMVPLGLTANRLAIELRVPSSQIADLVHQRRAMTADTALRLSRYFSMSADFWMTLQTNYDLQTARTADGATIYAEIRPRPAAIAS